MLWDAPESIVLLHLSCLCDDATKEMVGAECGMRNVLMFACVICHHHRVYIYITPPGLPPPGLPPPN